MNAIDTKSLKVGDVVLIRESPSWYSDTYKSATVTKVTRTGIVTVKTENWEVVFNPNGHPRGECYGRVYLEPFDQSVLDRQTRRKQMQKNRSRLKGIDWDRESDSLVLKAIALLDAEGADKPGGAS